MPVSGKTTPPASDPRSGRNPGYAETEPRDREDAHYPKRRDKPNPDEGAIDRDLETGPEPDAPAR
ncbi:hypothetical protein [Lysobacter arvi]|uniref:Uncharacterized protein n=1 Tax=Lysobacter arvi TaxID=3038776 RepID=A0ABU1CBW9_9GAMM|nr:hypothetical protein [Lysobacter arvi]MDR0182684.1 hypothetical protein [Lysobacter arvi]